MARLDYCCLEDQVVLIPIYYTVEFFGGERAISAISMIVKAGCIDSFGFHQAKIYGHRLNALELRVTG